MAKKYIIITVDDGRVDYEVAGLNHVQAGQVIEVVLDHIKKQIASQMEAKNDTNRPA